MTEYLITLSVAFLVFLVFMAVLLKTRKNKSGIDAYQCDRCDDRNCDCRKIEDPGHGQSS